MKPAITRKELHLSRRAGKSRWAAWHTLLRRAIEAAPMRELLDDDEVAG